MMIFLPLYKSLLFFHNNKNNASYIKLDNLHKHLSFFSSLFEISNNPPGTIEFFLGSISAALYLLLKVNLKSFKINLF